MEKPLSAVRAVHTSIHSPNKLGPGSWIDANWAYQERYFPWSHTSEPGGEEIRIWMILEMHIYKAIIEECQRSIEGPKNSVLYCFVFLTDMFTTHRKESKRIAVVRWGWWLVLLMYY